MKLFIHEYGGHPFATGLSRELAARGYMVTHAFFPGDSRPKGRLTRIEHDPLGLRFRPITLDRPYSKSNFVKRRFGDVAYGRKLAAAIEEERPDLVISGTTPTESQTYALKAARSVGAGFVFWCQDFFSVAAKRLLARRLPGLGHGVGLYYEWLEKRQMRGSDHIVHITDGFYRQTDAWAIPRERVSVIPNWGAFEEITPRERVNPWAEEQGLANAPVALYSGTLAMKHNPALLSALSEVGLARVVVIGAGEGAERLAREKGEGRWPHLALLPLQPFDRFSEVLGSADVLLAVLERDAGVFSVPSKVLSYLCAGRPIVLAAPAENLASKIVRESGAGLVVEPEDTEGFIGSVRTILSDPEKAAEMGAAGRRYAESHFDVARVADKFEEVIRSVSARR